MLITKEAECLWEQREHGKSLPSAQFCHERDTAPQKKKKKKKVIWFLKKVLTEMNERLT